MQGAGHVLALTFLMCTIAILFGVADVPLVVAANRDELYARATRATRDLGAGIAGGVDEESGGPGSRYTQRAGSPR